MFDCVYVAVTVAGMALHAHQLHSGEAGGCASFEHYPTTLPNLGRVGNTQYIGRVGSRTKVVATVATRVDL